MNKKKKDDENMQATVATPKTNKKNKIQAIYKRAVKANGKALEKLSKN